MDFKLQQHHIEKFTIYLILSLQKKYIYHIVDDGIKKNLATYNKITKIFKA